MSLAYFLDLNCLWNIFSENQLLHFRFGNKLVQKYIFNVFSGLENKERHVKQNNGLPERKHRWSYFRDVIYASKQLLLSEFCKGLSQFCSDNLSLLG